MWRVMERLRSGDVFVPGSRRYADPASFLLAPAAWEPLRAGFAALVGRPAGGAAAIAEADEELRAALADLEGVLARGGSELVTVVLGADAPPDLLDGIERWVERHHPGVEVVGYEGGQPRWHAIIGVE